MIYATARYVIAPPYSESSLVQGVDANGNVETVRYDHILFRQPEDGPMGFVARGGVIAPHLPAEPGPYRLYKSVFIRRMTETEAATMETVLAGADAKLRMMFNSVEYFISDDELFGTLVGAVGAALGEERAAELLAG